MNRLREVRQQHDLVLWALAAQAHVSPTMLSAVERHDYRPSVAVRERIAAVFGVAAAEIWPDHIGQEENL